MDEETLALADRAARRRRTSRGAFVCSAARAFAEGGRRAAQEAALLERRKKAIEGIRRISHKLGDWPAQEILRAARDRWSDPKGE